MCYIQCATEWLTVVLGYSCLAALAVVCCLCFVACASLLLQGICSSTVALRKVVDAQVKSIANCIINSAADVQTPESEEAPHSEVHNR